MKLHVRYWRQMQFGPVLVLAPLLGSTLGPHSAGPREPTPAPARVVSASLQPRAPASPPRSLASGVAFSVGMGSGYGGLFGAQLAVPIALTPPRIQVGPHLAIGVVPTGETQAQTGISGGVLGFVGERHRMFGLLDVGPVAFSRLYLHGTLVAWKALYGPSALVGYEFMSHGGIFVRVGGGGGVVWNEGSGVAQFTLGLGWKP